MDGGLTWSPNEQLTESFDSHLGWPNQNKLGDYYDLVSDEVGADLAFAATFNGEQDVYYMRLGGRDCNRNGVPDSDDINDGAAGDCNRNDIPDQCEIDAGAVADANEDGVPDTCDNPADLDGNGVVNVEDLLMLLGNWGPCVQSCPPSCLGDIDGDCAVDVPDLLTLLENWG